MTHHHHHSADELAKKLREMYSEIDKHNLDLDLEYKEDKDYWIIKLSKGDHRLHTLLNREDADSCLDDQKCVYLGVQIGQFVNNFEMYA